MNRSGSVNLEGQPHVIVRQGFMKALFPGRSAESANPVDEFPRRLAPCSFAFHILGKRRDRAEDRKRIPAVNQGLRGPRTDAQQRLSCWKVTPRDEELVGVHALHDVLAHETPSFGLHMRDGERRVIGDAIAGLDEAEAEFELLHPIEEALRIHSHLVESGPAQGVADPDEPKGIEELVAQQCLVRVRELDRIGCALLAHPAPECDSAKIRLGIEAGEQAIIEIGIPFQQSVVIEEHEDVALCTRDASIAAACDAPVALERDADAPRESLEGFEHVLPDDAIGIVVDEDDLMVGTISNNPVKPLEGRRKSVVSPIGQDDGRYARLERLHRKLLVVPNALRDQASASSTRLPPKASTFKLALESLCLVDSTPARSYRFS
jgi:hypothetical protein